MVTSKWFYGVMIIALILAGCVQQPQPTTSPSIAPTQMPTVTPTSRDKNYCETNDDCKPLTCPCGCYNKNYVDSMSSRNPSDITCPCIAPEKCVCVNKECRKATPTPTLTSTPTPTPTAAGNAVVLATDKNAYQRSEKISITLTNGLRESVWVTQDCERWWELETFDGGEWKNIAMPSCIMCELGPMPQLLKAGEKVVDAWYGDFGCAGGFEATAIAADAGTYRLKSSYYFDCRVNESKYSTYSDLEKNCSGMKEIYSNEFTLSAPAVETFRKSEPIKFKIDGVFQVRSNDLPFSIISLTHGINGLQLKHSCNGKMGYGIDEYCENGKIVLRYISTLCSFSEKWCNGCSDVIGWENTIVDEEFSWNQKEYVSVSEWCENTDIHREVPTQVPEGRYAIVVKDKVVKEFVIQ
ncbi:MAG: hypothetical protein V1817_04165 [Candidatus Micrarchaeota archaeon]